MKKLLTVMMVAIMSFTLLTGCGNEKKETVTTDGSTSMEKVIVH